jgi:hypothetical protein
LIRKNRERVRWAVHSDGIQTQPAIKLARSNCNGPSNGGLKRLGSTKRAVVFASRSAPIDDEKTPHHDIGDRDVVDVVGVEVRNRYTAKRSPHRDLHCRKKCSRGAAK